MPFGKLRSSAAIARPSRRVRPRGGCVLRDGSPPYMSKPKLPTYGAAAAVDDHVVARARARASRDPRAPSSAPSCEPQHLPIDHRHDEHRTVGQPSEPDWADSAPRRSSRTRPSCRPRRRAGRAWSREEQPILVPARPFREARARRAEPQVSARSGPYSSGRSVGLTSSSVWSCRLGQARHEEDRGDHARRCRTARSTRPIPPRWIRERSGDRRGPRRRRGR